MGKRVIFGFALLAWSAQARAQRPVPNAQAPVTKGASCMLVACPASVAWPASHPLQAPPASAWPIAASAILPGLGQSIQGVDRALAYFAVEAFAWAAHAWFSSDSRRHRDGYRNLASRVARAGFSQVRPNGDFAYYERMSHYPEAGRYDVVAGGRIDPEPDPTTYNGATWELARRTYWNDPAVMPDTASLEWRRSIEFYEARAYDEIYRWSWSAAPDEYDRFKSLIEQSNDANRRSLEALGVVIANHVLSMVDALIVVRLRSQGDGERRLSIQGTVPLPRLAGGG